MANTIGVVMTTKVVAGLIDEHKLQGELREFPEDLDATNGLIEVPAESLCDILCEAVAAMAPTGSAVEAIGVAMPGYVHQGVMLDSPNLPQLKGARVCDSLKAGLEKRGIGVKLRVFNDADAVAAGIAATRGQLDRTVRVWTVGNGIGFGRYPWTEGPWEGGHTVVTLDPKERYCGCGGLGHLEGVLGHRAMRLRFLDMEPDEVFAAAKKGDRRCREFVELAHRALAAATASQIHLEGPGRFYYTGRDIQRLDLSLLKQFLYEMVKMSPLQNYSAEMLPEDPALAVIGAGVAALLADRC
ncbi:MAG TPA: ROK family protein [Acidobacteriaceae bacterium]|jgi:predicted NBD/HSP70 family sugar kinase|nr:ROK family protein [Acidobacteriaceae bacterium]